MASQAHSFEISYVTELLEDPADDRLDRLAEILPNVVTSFDGDLTVVTALLSAADALEAGVAGARAIEFCGIRVARTYQDLVTRNDVADRLSVTRQAVGNWVRGERLADVPFPAPVSLVAGGIWLWADVAQWARQHGGLPVEDVSHPTLEDHNRLDLLIEAGIRSVTVTTFAAGEVAFGSRTTTTHSYESYQTTYALAS